ncbi:uncharacterized protein MYCFIDRAFT_182368 [Pseudocercospora fijiensis CIRAD86]|uniref:RRM domain-containing protein n=1 Tax=Pseudocercospora fijiensis (strain CIRAD86) TaxID=383855 RepID=M3AIS8_PSEFD|nr:uncharacterized protein MYCFIDRAFT_182368 [Pseudocercospora fijiensis CIRAD86]EME84501.1 hypothetical protein MYCFIDRAFT_182368 [Pseudocercospora fijiensis CIRAD86]
MPSLQASTSDPVSFGGVDTRPAPAVVIRRLPRNIGNEALRSMLIFAGDLIDTEFIRSPYPEDAGYATAVARFQTSAGALEAQQKLHGKPNTTKEASMIVEAHSTSSVGAFERRNTIDGTASRTQNSSASSGGVGRSRFNSTFQTTAERRPFQNLFSPQSPLANGVDGHSRISGKSVINDDSVDDETGDILKDPVAYAKSGQQPATRRATTTTIPVNRFGSLSLSSTNGLTSPSAHGFPTQRGNGSISGPSAQVSPNGNPNGTFPMPGFPRPQYPPVNPADQNPPCNTLYVGNLPIDTSEDELKSLFSKQRGYKRLCFRTKQNGPMCFVEFEDISFATKALHELYGHPLHNSVKGGIRLSFSKNPLGVRSNQMNGGGASTPMSPQAMSPGYTGMATGANFSAVSGPPPGLGTPPGLNNGGGYRAPQTGMDGMFSNPFSVPSQDFVSQLSPRNYSGGVPQPLGAGTFGRDSRGFTDYALGR